MSELTCRTPSGSPRNVAGWGLCPLACMFAVWGRVPWSARAGMPAIDRANTSPTTKDHLIDLRILLPSTASRFVVTRARPEERARKTSASSVRAKRWSGGGIPDTWGAHRTWLLRVDGGKGDSTHRREESTIGFDRSRLALIHWSGSQRQASREGGMRRVLTLSLLATFGRTSALLRSASLTPRRGSLDGGDEMRRRISVVFSMVLAFGMSSLAPPASASHGPDQHSQNMKHLSNVPRSSVATQSDLAFVGKRAFAGNYNGFRILDVSDPNNPVVVRDVWCPGPQNDISVWGDAIVLSIDSVRLANPDRPGANAYDCDSIAASGSDVQDPDAWEGLRIFSLDEILSM